MADTYIVNSSDLVTVADAIRAKAGTTDQLSFPEGFNDAIANIQTGGEAPQAYVEEIVDDSGNLIRANVVGYVKIRNKAFQNESHLADVSLPEGLISIDASAFNGCSKLALTSLPEGLTSIGNSAFYNCSNLSLTSLPEGLTSIDGSSFYKCSKLALTSLPEGITSIGYNAFYYCYNMALTLLPESLTKIDKQAFYNCQGLQSITCKSKPTIANNSFSACANLTTINVPWAEGEVSGAPWGATNATINYNYTGE